MVELRKGKTLQLDEHLPFQQREWQASRMLLAFLLLVMLATGLGLFGNGPLSDARIEASGGGLAVEYDRFGRFGSSMRLLVQVPAASHGSTQVEFSRSLIESFLVTHVTPEPASTTLTPESVQYAFDAVAAPGGAVVFDLQPRKRWLLEGYVRSAGDTLSLWIFIYP